MVLLFFVSANGWTYLVLKNSLSNFTTNNCQVRQSDQSILKNWANSSIYDIIDQDQDQDSEEIYPK